jgi:hypothetical protein
LGSGKKAPPFDTAEPADRPLKFSLFDGFFDGILNQMVVPFVVKGLFIPDGGLDKKFKLIVAGFADVPVGDMEIVPVVDGLLDGFSAHIAGNGLHILLLLILRFYDGLPAAGRKPIIMVYLNSELPVCRVGFETGQCIYFFQLFLRIFCGYAAKNRALRGSALSRSGRGAMRRG